MFEKYMIGEDGFSNVVADGKVTGFQFNARLPYYRGLGVSMIENIWLTVDGADIPQDKIRVTLHGHTYTLDEMEHESEDRWEFGEVGIVTVDRVGGLQPGTHTIKMKDHLRISYLPFPLYGESTKELRLANEAATKE